MRPPNISDEAVLARQPVAWTVPPPMPPAIPVGPPAQLMLPRATATWDAPQSASGPGEALQRKVAEASVGLNNGQLVCLQQACRALSRRQVWRLAGPAGTGKTYLTQRICQVLTAVGIPVLGMAPTGRAALRLAESIPGASTIHSAIFSRVAEDLEGNPIFSEQNLKFPLDSGVVIIDESSMIGARLRGYINKAAPSDVGILYQGDPEQLPPVDEAPGVDLTQAESTLTEVMRQAQDSPILSLATAIRTRSQNMGMPDPRLAIHGKSAWEAPVAWLAAQRRANPLCDAALTTWANTTRRRLNHMVRTALGRSDYWLGPGDRLLVRKTNHHLGLLNGEVLLVHEIRPMRVFEEDFVEVHAARLAGQEALPVRLTIMVRAFGAKPKDAAIMRRQFLERILQMLYPSERSMARQGKLPERYAAEELLIRTCTLVDYGEALTVHALQGSQVHDLGFVMDAAMAWLARKSLNPRDPDCDLHRRLCYTAVTRAVETLNIWEVN